MTRPPLKYPDHDYLSFDPGAGDKDDGDIRNRTVSFVTARKEHPCHLSLSPFSGRQKHNIQPGDLYVREKAIFEGRWCYTAACIPCIEAEIEEYG